MEPNGLSPIEGPAQSQADLTAVIEPPVPGAELDISQMTRDQIAAKIEEDSDFAAKVASGKLKIPPEAPAPGEEPPAQPAEIPQQNMDPAAIPELSPEQIAAGDIPIPAQEPPAEPGQEPPAEAEILNFQIPKADMDGYSTPGEAIKANRHANAKIDTQDQIIAARDQVILDLNSKLESMKSQAPQPPPVAAVPAISEPPQGEDGEPDIYDPAYLKSIGKTADAMKILQEEVKDLKDEVKSERQKTAAEKAMQSHFGELSEFQALNPEFATNVPIEKVNKDYQSFIRNLGAAVGTDGSTDQNMRVVNAYLHDSSEQGDNLRATAESRGVDLPEDFDNYSRLLQVSSTRSQYSRQGPSGNPEPISLEEAKNLIYGRTVQDEPVANPEPEQPASPPPGQPGAPAIPNPPAPNMGTGLAEREQYAIVVPPGSTGPDQTLESLTSDQQAALLDTPPAELQRNPQKLKLVNEIYKRLGQPPLNPFGQNI